MIKQRIYLVLDNLFPISRESKYWFCLFFFDIFDCYLFHLIILLKPDFNCSNSFALS